MLRVTGIEAGYGSIRVLKGVDLEVKAGEIVALIGANGAGKTTLLKVISGVHPAVKGNVVFQGRSIIRRAPHAIARQGIVLVQEGRAILNEMTVLENLQMGGFHRTAHEIGESLEIVFRMFPLLKERQRQMGGTLSGGEQQMLALGRAFMARPKIVMMDEPSLGLAPKIVNEVFDKIRELKSADVAILLVEQNARKALAVADRALVLQLGRVVLSGTARELLGNEEVKAAYLGTAVGKAIPASG